MRIGLGELCCAARTLASHQPEQNQRSGLRIRAGSDTPVNCVAGGRCRPPAIDASVVEQPTASQTPPCQETENNKDSRTTNLLTPERSAFQLMMGFHSRC